MRPLHHKRFSKPFSKQKWGLTVSFVESVSSGFLNQRSSRECVGTVTAAVGVKQRKCESIGKLMQSIWDKLLGSLQITHLSDRVLLSLRLVCDPSG